MRWKFTAPGNGNVPQKSLLDLDAYKILSYGYIYTYV